MIDKLPIIEALDTVRAALEARLRAAQLAAADAYDAATQEEAKAEDKYDTRALEQSYLSAGQNARIAELRQTLTALHFFAPLPPSGRVVPGSLVEADVDGKTALYLLLPLAIGERVQVRDLQLDVVSTGAPIGQALLGKCEGDTATLVVAGKRREVEIVAIR